MRVVFDPALPELTEQEQDLIERADALGRGLLAENATAIDRGETSVRGNLEALATAGLAGVTAPRAYGGAEMGRAARERVLEGLCYGDGTTPFVIAQHYGTISMLAAGANAALRDRMLPDMASGQFFCGFGISQVRRGGRPALAATRDGDGYCLDGFIPWMTGRDLFSYTIIAGTLPSGESLLVWTPFKESDELHLSAPMQLVAMNGARTISATIEGLEVGPGDVVAVEPPGSRERANTTAVPCLFGLTRAAIDDLAELAKRRNAPVSAQAAERLGARLDELRRYFYGVVLGTGGEGQNQEGEAPLARSRAGATALALDAIGALIVATGGGANAATHPAQRRLREASVFSTWGVSVQAVNQTVTTLSSEG